MPAQKIHVRIIRLSDGSLVGVYAFDSKAKARAYVMRWNRHAEYQATIEK
jgi:hypothetical protein